MEDSSPVNRYFQRQFERSRKNVSGILSGERDLNEKCRSAPNSAVAGRDACATGSQDTAWETGLRRPKRSAVKLFKLSNNPWGLASLRTTRTGQSARLTISRVTFPSI